MNVLLLYYRDHVLIENLPLDFHACIAPSHDDTLPKTTHPNAICLLISGIGSPPLITVLTR